MSAIYLRPIPGANGDIRKGLKILCGSIPVTTEVYCPYIGYIFPVPAGQPQNNISELPNETL